MKTFFFALIISAISVFIGIGMVTVFKPGKSLNAGDRTHLIEQFAGNAGQIKTNMDIGNERSAGEILVSLIPKNPVEDMARAFDPSYRGGGILWPSCSFRSLSA